MTDKQELRNKYKIGRKNFHRSAREVADGAICDYATAALDGVDSVLIYYSFGSEADTHELVRRLICAGKRVYLPRVEGRDIVAVRYYGEEDKLIKNARFGVFEPDGEASEEEIEACITPLLAINPQGFRLGYGGGYYDRYFAKHADILKIGLGYFFQYSEDFTADGWDEPLDKFVCERGIIYFEKRNRA